MIRTRALELAAQPVRGLIKLVLLALPPSLGAAMNWAFCAALLFSASLVALVVREVHCRPTDADDAWADHPRHIQETGSEVSTTF